jgi:hypothetical protein
MTDWMWFVAGVGSLVAVLIIASFVSRLFREPAAHRAGIDEDEDDPEPAAPPLHIQSNLFKHGVGSAPDNIYYDADAASDLGPPPTYPETPEEHTR